MEKVPMTEAGYAALDEEIKRLKGPERQRIIKAIAEARAWRFVGKCRISRRQRTAEP